MRNAYIILPGKPICKLKWMIRSEIMRIGHGAGKFFLMGFGIVSAELSGT
jgi:hypothetical protein